MSGYSSIGRWCSHLSSWITHFPCPAVARFTAGQSPESRSTLPRQSSRRATRAAWPASASSLRALTTANPRALRSFFRSFNAGLSCRPARLLTDLFSAIPRAIAGSVTAAYSIFETAGLFPVGYSDRDLKSLEEMLSRFYGLANSIAPRSFRAPPEKAASRQPSDQGPVVAPFNIVTMKQIRDVHSSSAACFQAIVGSKMQIERTIDGGSLFDPLAGDMSGGIYINLLDSVAQPIVRTLGLETSEHSSVGGKPASTLRPTMPFWLKMDLGYGLADSQCWRTNTTKWSSGDTLKQIPRREIAYLNLGSGASEEVSGPYHFPQITLRVMPLRAERTSCRTWSIGTWKMISSSSR